jgi:hypothetical protein
MPARELPPCPACGFPFRFSDDTVYRLDDGAKVHTACATPEPTC